MRRYKKINGFYFEKEEETLIPILLPKCYMDNNIKKLHTNYSIRSLQNELNEILNSFINGGFSYKGFMLYPIVKDVSAKNIRKITRLKKIALHLNSNGYDFSHSLKKFDMNLNSKNFAVLLSELYKDFSKIKVRETDLVKKPKCKKFDVDDYEKTDLNYLRPLSDLFAYANSYLKQYLSGFYLHGSLATKDYVKGWSDVDTLSIISKKTINDANALLELRERTYYMRRFFYRIDPLQHHGTIIISEYDLERYCQTYFPIPIFKYSKSFFSTDRMINFKVRNYSSEALKRLFWFVNYFRSLKYMRTFDLGSYDTKTLLHSITLFPSLYLQAKGTLVYKKFSFDIAKKDFNKHEWGIIDYISSVRSNWVSAGNMPVVDILAERNPLLFYQLNSRFMDLFNSINKCNKINTEGIIDSMLQFSEKAWKKIKEKWKE